MQRQGAVVDEVQLGLEVFAVEAQVPVEEVQLLGRLVEGLGGGAGLLAARGETQQAVADRNPLLREPELAFHRFRSGEVPRGQLVGSLSVPVRVAGEVGADVLIDAAEGQGVPGPRRAVVELRFPHLRLGGADRDDGVDHVVAGDDVDHCVRGGRELGQLPPPVGQDDRIGHLETLDPSRMRVFQRRLHDRRADDGDLHVAAQVRDDGLTHRLGEGVDVGPAQRTGPFRARGYQFLLHPGEPPPFGVLAGGEVSGAAVQFLGLLAQRRQLLGGAGPCLDEVGHRQRRPGLGLVVHLVGVGGLRDRPPAAPRRVGRRDVDVVRDADQVAVLVGAGFAESFQQRLDAQHVGLERRVDGRVEGDVPCAVHQHVDVARQFRGVREIALDHIDASVHQFLDGTGLGDDVLEDLLLEQRGDPLGGRQGTLAAHQHRGGRVRAFGEEFPEHLLTDETGDARHGDLLTREQFGDPPGQQRRGVQAGRFRGSEAGAWRGAHAASPICCGPATSMASARVNLPR